MQAAVEHTLDSGGALASALPLPTPHPRGTLWGLPLALGLGFLTCEVRRSGKEWPTRSHLRLLHPGQTWLINHEPRLSPRIFPLQCSRKPLLID